MLRRVKHEFTIIQFSSFARMRVVLTVLEAIC